MAAISSNGTGGGNWSSTSTWSGGVIPTASDDVTVVNGDTVTKDSYNESSYHCQSINVLGTLVIDDNVTLRIGADASNDSIHNNAGSDGKIQMGPGSVLRIKGEIEQNNDLQWDCQGNSGNFCKITISDLDDPVGPSWWIYGYDANGNKADTFKYCHFDSTGLVTEAKPSIYFSNFNRVYDTIEHVWFGKSSTGTPFAKHWPQWYGGTPLFKNCWFSSVQRGLGVGTGIPNLLDAIGCEFGYDPSGNSYPVTNLAGGGLQERTGNWYAYGCKENYTNLGGINLGWGKLYMQNVNQGGGWRICYKSAWIERAAAAAKSGSFGIMFTPSSGIGDTHPLTLDIPIPVESGDSISPSIYYKNVTADMDLEAASGRLTFELDPGDAWGLNEKIDASSLGDPYNNWVQASFTGGTAGGSGEKGTVLLRVELRRYVASGVLYVADLLY